jgi:hypothetical protein
VTVSRASRTARAHDDLLRVTGAGQSIHHQHQPHPSSRTAPLVEPGSPAWHGRDQTSDRARSDDDNHDGDDEEAPL